jgi:hypothetical protein
MKIKFIQSSRAWYGKTALSHRNYFDDIMVQLYDDSDEFVCEFSVEFHDLNGPCAQLAVFDDSTEALINCGDMVRVMSGRKGWTPPAFVEMLIDLGYEDITPEFQDGKGRVKMEMAKERLVPMVTALANSIDWNQIPGDFVPIGLFVKRGQFFVAPICIGAPDVIDEDLLIGSSIYGTSSISMSDEEQDHYETADMLLANPDQFFAAMAS